MQLVCPMSGYRGHHPYLAQLSALWTVRVGLSVPYFVLIVVDQHDVRYGSIAPNIRLRQRSRLRFVSPGRPSA